MSVDTIVNAFLVVLLVGGSVVLLRELWEGSKR